MFALALRKDVKHPFPMESDEVTVDTSHAATKSRRARTRRDDDDSYACYHDG